MSEFEFAFSLFGLILGLALAEALASMVRAIDTRGKLRIGWLTPMICSGASWRSTGWPIMAMEKNDGTVRHGS